MMAVVDQTHQYASLAIAATTNVCCIYVVFVMIWWWSRLRYIHSRLRPFFLAVGLAKAAIWYWSATNIVQIMVFDIHLPMISLPARVFMMCAVLMQVFVTLQYYGGGALMPETKEEGHGK